MAIDKDGVKSACMSCIRGHRVKRCQHHDRKLVPITKPGRQISQCSHCRDLRLTHKTHVKCNCAIAQGY
ncbi:hypothetical protein J3Q64DRAFT_1752066 [Phycomyces blakesleeanus]|uniref:Copper-fist domain-containing protein n=1 Tax=Phycomyces blakesleeanus TaxID=4837 RepID=A0ABR3ATT1_PHYBL